MGVLQLEIHSSRPMEAHWVAIRQHTVAGDEN